MTPAATPASPTSSSTSAPTDAGPPKPDASPDPEPIDRPSRYLASNRNVDLLFLVDDSSSMRLSQDNLRRNFPVLMQALKNQPGGLPNVHIGVISSDMGAGDGSVAGCDSTGGKNGIFQYTPRGTCTSSGLLPGATYISDIGGVKNYSGNLEDVFTCIAALGESGCGFEHQFAAITRALGVDGLGAAPAENAGFLRPDALLAIVLITNEDDCSAAPGQGPNRRIPLFDTAVNNNLASQLGPPANFRCNEFGHICNGTHPNRNAPNNNLSAMVTYDDCTSNDTEGYLLSVADTVNRIRALKADDGQVMVTAITGPRAPYVVNWRAPSTSRHLVRRGVLSLADDRALVHGGRQQLRRPGRPHRRDGRPLRRQRPHDLDLRRRVQRRARRHRQRRSQLRQRALHHGPHREEGGHDAR